MIPHLQLFSGTIALGVAALVAWMFWMLPAWSRPGIYFGVTVRPDFRSTPEARDLLRKYRIQAMMWVASSFALISAGSIPALWFLLIVGVVWLAFGPLIAFLAAHKRVLPHAIPVPTVREAALEPRRVHAPGGWIAQIVPFAILAGAAVYLRLHWSEIPLRFPVHWGVNGQPNGWSVRTPLGVYTPLLLGAIIVLGISASSYGIRHYSRALPAAGSGPVTSDFPRKTTVFLLIIEFFLAAVFSLVALLPLIGNLPLLVLTIVTLPLIIILAAWLAKARASFGRDAVSFSSLAAAPIGDGTLDKYWKLGIFYFNPDDAALFVERRYGVGYTVNFARSGAWILLALVLAVPIVVLLLTVHQH